MWRRNFPRYPVGRFRPADAAFFAQFRPNLLALGQQKSQFDLLFRIANNCAHSRELVTHEDVNAGQVPADVQLYWFGFFTAAGYILGHGASLTLTVTLGDEGRGSLDTLEADLMMGPSRREFCHSSLAGWQGYFRDPTLCHALIPWGIPSDLYGEDPALLEDLPEELFVPFMRGYVEGGELARRPPARPHADGLAIRGTPAVLAGLNALIQRHWGILGGLITQVDGGAELRFSDRVARDAIEGRLDMISPGYDDVFI